MKKPSKERGGELAQSVLDALEIPAIVGNEMHIEMFGGREMTVEGVRGVIEYDDSLVRLAAGKKELRISGSGLSIRTLTKTAATVTGHIISVEFV